MYKSFMGAMGSYGGWSVIKAMEVMGSNRGRTVLKWPLADGVTLSTHAQVAWADMVAPMELEAKAAACMEDLWGPWDHMGVTALAWVAITDPATGPAWGVACMGGRTGAITAMDLGLEEGIWERLMEQALYQVHLVGLWLIRSLLQGMV